MKRPGLCTSCAGTGYAKITSFSLIPSTRRRRKKRNRLSANYTGKEDIQVLQNDIENNGRFIELSGLQQGGDRRQPIYEEVADALQGGPGPDVKISELWRPLFSRPDVKRRPPGPGASRQNFRTLHYQLLQTDNHCHHQASRFLNCPSILWKSSLDFCWQKHVL